MDELLQLSEEKDRRILNLEKKLAHFEERQLRLR